MKCPACEHELEPVTVEEVTVDACLGGCGGVWFDAFELRRFDEAHESGRELLEIERSPRRAVDRGHKIRCPRCRNSVMARHHFSVRRAVEVDECPTCGGFWLDFGELGQIRMLYDSEEARKEAARRYFEDVFGDALAAQRARSARARRAARLFRRMLLT